LLPALSGFITHRDFKTKPRLVILDRVSASITMPEPKVGDIHVQEWVTTMPADDVVDALIAQIGSSVFLHLEPRF
jgi:hypothetical protein